LQLSNKIGRGLSEPEGGFFSQEGSPFESETRRVVAKRSGSWQGELRSKRGCSGVGCFGLLRLLDAQKPARVKQFIGNNPSSLIQYEGERIENKCVPFFPFI
jgi:hypothetical protein